MATVNLGRIKPVFRGAYAGGTAYVVDDIVTSGDETFICIQAGTGNATSNASYWTKLAAKGTDGTNVATTITTQGDLLYRDGSGLQRLAKGTASQQLRMNSGANAPEWFTAQGGGILQVKTVQTGDYHATTNTSLGTAGYNVSDLGTTFTPTSASSHILITGMIHASHISSYTGRGFISYNHSGISETVIKSSASSNAYNCTFRFESMGTGTSNLLPACAINLHISPNTTNELTFKTYIMTSNSGHKSVINNTEANHTNSDDGGYTISSLTFWEIAGGISPSTSNTAITS